MRRRDTGNWGFTLVELSIVLVVIGLLIGGMLAGQSMIETVKGQQAIRDIQRINILVSQFKATFNCLPGDCANAASLSLGNSGNGDGTYADGFEGNFWLWEHLTKSGIADFKLSAPGNPGDGPKRNINIPAWDWLKSSRATGGAMGSQWTPDLYLKSGNLCAAPGWNGCEDFQIPVQQNWLTKNTIVIGGYAYHTDNSTRYILGSGFFSERAAMIDAKIDDGQPRTGKVKGYYYPGYGWSTNTISSCGDGTNSGTQGYKSGYTCGLFIDLDED